MPARTLVHVRILAGDASCEMRAGARLLQQCPILRPGAHEYVLCPGACGLLSLPPAVQDRVARVGARWAIGAAGAPSPDEARESLAARLGAHPGEGELSSSLAVCLGLLECLDLPRLGPDVLLPGLLGGLLRARPQDLPPLGAALPALLALRGGFPDGPARAWLLAEFHGALGSGRLWGLLEGLRGDGSPWVLLCLLGSLLPRGSALLLRARALRDGAATAATLLAREGGSGNGPFNVAPISPPSLE
jgi:hypothetical protein